MKRGILVATLMVTAAGVASANLLTPAPPGVASSWPQAQPATVPPPVITSSTEKTVTAQLAPTAPAKVASAQTTKSMVEANQAPVPFKMKPRPPVNLPPVADKAIEAKTTDKPAEASTDPAAADGAGENAARAAIEADGYKGVKVLRKGANGVWHASALRGKTTVMLTVDSSGSVSAD